MTSDLAQRVLDRDRRALTRALTFVENGQPEGLDALRELYPKSGRAHVVGVTGTTGSGKSTLVGALAREYRKQDRTIGIVAVDPTSPFTRGAILGDRIRMQDLTSDPGVFIRSMATRGALGGLAAATGDVVTVLDAAGFDVVIIETVGAGQDEVEIAGTAHTTVVINTPGAGDDIQAIKAGILEIADILVVNKADLPGAESVYKQLHIFATYTGPSKGRQGPGGQVSNLTPPAHPEGSKGREEPGGQVSNVTPGGQVSNLTPTTHPEGSKGHPEVSKDEGWNVPIIKTVAHRDQGAAELLEAIDRHREYLQTSGRLEEMRRVRARRQLLAVAQTLLLARVLDAPEAASRLDQLVDQIAARQIDPHTAADQLIASTR